MEIKKKPCLGGHGLFVMGFLRIGLRRDWVA